MDLARMLQQAQGGGGMGQQDAPVMDTAETIQISSLASLFRERFFILLRLSRVDRSLYLCFGLRVVPPGWVCVHVPAISQKHPCKLSCGGGRLCTYALPALP